mgnify:CR=1 FL=1
MNQIHRFNDNIEIIHNSTKEKNGIPSDTDIYADSTSEEFLKTAELLGYSQSAVTVQIRQLETELGVRLFDRTGKKVILTPKGKEFLIHANKIIDEMHKAKDAMNDTAELKNPLHIGTIESLCTVKLQEIVQRFRKEHPQVRIQITIGSPERLIQKMEHNELDVIYILDTPRWNKNWVKVMEKAEPVIFVSAPNYKLAGKKNIEVEEILNAPFYLTERNANYRQALEQELALHKQTLSPVLECSDTAFIKKMLKTGKGLSYLPLFVVEKDIEEGKIAKLDVKDIDITMYRQVFYHANKYMTKEMEKFCGVLQVVICWFDNMLEIKF